MNNIEFQNLRRSVISLDEHMKNVRQELRTLKQSIRVLEGKLGETREKTLAERIEERLTKGGEESGEDKTS